MGLIKLIRSTLNKPPKDWWLYHSEDCGTKYRGCAPDCPKDIWEREKRWVGK
jgi:hypothetical protein